MWGGRERERVSEKERERETQTDRQTDSQTDRQTDRENHVCDLTQTRLTYDVPGAVPCQPCYS